MADREKLIELLDKAMKYALANCKSANPRAILETKDMADYILADGATIQKWTPATELPMDKSGHYLTCDHKGNMHVMFHHKVYDDPFGIDENHPAYFPVLWFMPLPEAPKGE